jgi:hypothetical protein
LGAGGKKTYKETMLTTSGGIRFNGVLIVFVLERVVIMAQFRKTSNKL